MTADRDRFPRLPWRRSLGRLLALALVFAAVNAAGRRALGDGAADAAVGGGIMTVPLMVLWTWEWRRRRRELLRSGPPDFTREQWAAALKASTGGPVPSDPVVRAEAARMARSGYAAYQGESPWLVLVLLGLLALGGAVAALVSSPWWWVVASAVVLLAVHLFWARKRLEQRLKVLREP